MTAIQSWSSVLLYEGNYYLNNKLVVGCLHLDTQEPRCYFSDEKQLSLLKE